MSPCRAAWIAFAWMLAALVAPAAEPDPDVAFAERTLKEAGVATDGPGLLAFFRTRTLSEADQERLGLTVKRLGDDQFAVRERASLELVHAGRPAIAFLKPALTDADQEIVRRARLCLQEIEQQPNTLLMSAAARLLADRRPQGTVEALLAYLPCVDEDSVEEAVFAALARAGLNGGKPDAALVAALEDKHTIRRAAAAHVVGKAAAGERRGVARLLTDADVRVRHEAACALAQAGDRQAVPALIAMLDLGPPRLAWQAEDLLARLAGDTAPTVPLGTGSGDDRRKSREAWEGWWRTHGPRVDMARLQGEEPLLGLTLICEYDGGSGGRVWECGRDGKPRWQIAGLQGPNDAQLLPGGRVLIAERNGARVTERDRQGKVLWTHHAPGSPISCQRLPSGNTLVATFSELYEVTPEGRKAFTHSHPAGFRHAVRLRNGHILYVSSNGQVVELDPAWKQLRTITPASYAQGAGYWASVDLLASGRFLVALGGANKVVEIDAAGRVVWECGMASAVCATRLRNGNTLIACFESRAMVEVNREGKEVSRQTLGGRPFMVRRY